MSEIVSLRLASAAKAVMLLAPKEAAIKRGSAVFLMVIMLFLVGSPDKVR